MAMPSTTPNAASPWGGYRARLFVCGLLVILAACSDSLAARPGGTTDGLPGSKSWPAPGATIDADQLAGLADGTLPDGEQLIASWVRPFFRCRTVVSRAELGECAIGWRYIWPGKTQAGLQASFRSELAVNDSPWKGYGHMVTVSSPNSFGQESSSTSPEQMRDVLEGFLDRDQVTIRPRLVVRVERVRTDGKDSVAGTEWTWVGEPTTAAIRDAYPPDYPLIRSDAETEGAMRQLLATASAECSRQRQVDGALNVQLTVPPGAQSAVPAAFTVELQQPGQQGSLGWTILAWSAGPLALWPKATQSWQLDFERPDDAAAAARWNAMLADLRARRIEQLRLVFQPAHAVAVQQPDFDEYWGGSFEVAVAVNG